MVERLGTMAADYQLVDMYLQQGDTLSATALINALPTTYGFESDNAEYLRYKALKQLQVRLISEGRNIYMLTAAEKTLLEDMVANSDGRTGMQARNILQFVYGNQYVDCPKLPDTITHKSAKATINDLISNLLAISANPNPAKSWTAFNYSLPETSEKAVIEVYTLKGKLIQTFNLSNIKGQVIWDTRSTIPGMYLFTLKTAGMSKSGKLIIK